MCAIAGYYSPEARFSRSELEVMTNCLSHRGPDSEGYFFDDIAGLGHKRLKILDLSDKGNQPMHSKNGRFVIAYNGEVYNYNEIARELRAENTALNFVSSSDTEVILEAFSFWGEHFVHRLNGMFAIAIYDKIEKELYLYRDRIGIKPLYYHWDGSSLLFASEINSFKEVQSVEKTINQQAIAAFLHLGYIPAPLSIYESIHKLEAGAFLKISKNTLIKAKYWEPHSVIREGVITDEMEAQKQLESLIAHSVKSQLIADVPSGVFLSGGIDSSLIAAMAVKVSSAPINTFSIGFKENKFDESVHAQKVAGHLKTNHHEFIVSHNDAIQILTGELFNTYGEPFADSSAIPTMLVSKLAKQYVTVALSGEGGDELFFGYGAYQWAKRLHNPFVKLFKNTLSVTLNPWHPKASSLLKYNSSHNIHSHIFSQEQHLFSMPEVLNLINKAVGNNFMIDMKFPASRKLSEMEMQALFDLQYYLPDDLLTKVDRASMHYSLEARVPYLDHNIVELALNISPDLKYKNGETKYLLKKILYQYIPKAYFDRPKQGFSVPLQQWLDNDLNFLINDFLSEKIIKKYGLVNYKEVEKLKIGYKKGGKYLYNKLWLLIVLHKWLCQN